MLLHIALPGSGTSAFDFWVNDILPAHWVWSEYNAVRPERRMPRAVPSTSQAKPQAFVWASEAHPAGLAYSGAYNVQGRVVVMPEAFAIPRLAGELVRHCRILA